MAKKFIVGIMTLLLLAMPMLLDAKNKGVAKIEFNEYSYDFGIVQEKNGLVSHEFEFTNVGDGNLIIIEATATCGCTRPEYPQHPIAPGKKGKIKVTYNPIGRQGAIDRVVTVKTNGSPKKVRLKLKGNVVPGK